MTRRLRRSTRVLALGVLALAGVAYAQAPWEAPPAEKAKRNPLPADAKVVDQGQKIAQMMAGDNPENPFVGIPFPGAPLGLYNGKPWFLPLAGAWYKVLDWVG